LPLVGVGLHFDSFFAQKPSFFGLFLGFLDIKICIPARLFPFFLFRYSFHTFCFMFQPSVSWLHRDSSNGQLFSLKTPLKTGKNRVFGLIFGFILTQHKLEVIFCRHFWNPVYSHMGQCFGIDRIKSTSIQAINERKTEQHREKSRFLGNSTQQGENTVCLTPKTFPR